MRTSDLIQACYNRLNVSAVSSLLSQSYNVPAIFQRGRVPRNDAGDALFFPYITFHVPSDADFSTAGTLGGSAIIQVDVWDRSGSALALGLIVRQVLLQTVRQTWTVPGFMTCERESTEIMADPDGLTRRGMIRLRVLYVD